LSTSLTSACRRRWAAEREIGGLAFAASSPSGADGWRSRRRATSASSGRQLVEVERADRFELLVRGAGGALEVRLVGVREPVRLGARGGEEGVLLELQDGVAGACEREQAGDRLVALRVGDGVAAALGDAKLDVLARGDLRDEPGAVDAGGAQLEVRVARARQRAGAEQRPAEVGAA